MAEVDGVVRVEMVRRKTQRDERERDGELVGDMFEREREIEEVVEGEVSSVNLRSDSQATTLALFVCVRKRELWQRVVASRKIYVRECDKLDVWGAL